MSFRLEGRNSRSGSQHRSNDGLPGPSSLRGSPAPSVQPSVTPAPVPQQPKAAVPPTATVVQQQAAIAMDEEQLERKLKNILEEYLNECCTVDECDEDIKESLPASTLPKLVSYG